jgi:hypothetical protein
MVRPVFRPSAMETSGRRLREGLDSENVQVSLGGANMLKAFAMGAQPDKDVRYTTLSHDSIAIRYDSGRITQTIQRRREMRIARPITALILALVCVYLQAQPSEQNIDVTGKLVRAMAIGGGSIGWILELESAVTFDSKPVNSILVSYRKAEQLEKLENARVRVTGKIVHRHGVEEGEHLVLEVSFIKEAKATAQPAPAQPVPIQKIAVDGKLVRAMAIGGESTGWILELESTTTIDGKQVNSIQVSYRKTGELEKLENARVRATGKITRRHGVETGEHLVLDVSSIKAKPNQHQHQHNQGFLRLSNSEWIRKSNRRL